MLPATFLRSCGVINIPCASRGVLSRLQSRSFSFASRGASLSTFRHSRVAPQLRRDAFSPSTIPSWTRRFSTQDAATTKPPTAEQTKESLPILPSKGVGGWLMFSATLVLGVIVVGGVTRLTESGLSITEWRPVTGILPPLSPEDWDVEFTKYKATPEFKLMNHSMTLDDFKFIFFMEWGHRVLGRVIGLTFAIPLGYLILRNRLPSNLKWRLSGLALLIGAQGAMGWYMVKSGLEDSLMDNPNSVPRVSQYRLAAHLGLAFLLYLGMFGTGLAVIKDQKFANGAAWSGLEAGFKNALSNPLVKSFKRQSWALTGLVLLTALSGAFVAGLDAGLVYNEFPLMGGRLMPPTDELFAPEYAKKADLSDKWWRNIFENPTTVQFDHRVLATTTYVGIAALFAQTFRPALRAALPPVARLTALAAFAMANVQVALGISTLLYLVPVPLAAAHQAGSVMLLSAMVHLLISLRRPSTAATVWRQFFQQQKNAATSAVKNTR